jgi:hypothetical protein
MGERSEDDIVTRKMTRACWLPPVARAEDLPREDVREGTLCYVEGENASESDVWVYRDGKWWQLA